MQLSARNQLPGTVTAVKEGAVMAEVTVKLDNGPEVVSVITVDSARRLGLAAGSKIRLMSSSRAGMVYCLASNACGGQV